MKIPYFHVDAFAARAFEGNPAGVCPLAEWLPEEQLQAIAAENRLSETAFLVAEGNELRLRWFSPRFEVQLCGHATLAAAFVLFTMLEPARELVRFHTLSGSLVAKRQGDLVCLDFPALPATRCETLPAELNGLADNAVETLKGNENYFLVLTNESEVRSARPDFAQIEKLHPAGVCLTAPGTKCDFVSRYFAPSYGIPEDPVTGSTHCSLAPYWVPRLGKQSLHARQLSARGGELWCEPSGTRVLLKGRAVLWAAGEITL